MGFLQRQEYYLLTSTNEGPAAGTDTGGKNRAKSFKILLIESFGLEVAWH